MNPLLTPIEARLLGVLVEKQHTVPDSYPLSLNALVTGCNQKTSRDPVMDIPEAEALTALDALRSRSFVIESSGSRVARYAHNTERVLQLPPQSVALLATLMLRGPQTAAELRNNSERLYKFADVSSVEAFLDELAARAAGALVVLLPRAPGAREARWAHLLCGEPQIPPATTRESSSSGGSELVVLREEVIQLRAELAAQRALLTRVCSELGIDPE